MACRVFAATPVTPLIRNCRLQEVKGWSSKVDNINSVSLAFPCPGLVLVIHNNSRVLLILRNWQSSIQAHGLTAPAASGCSFCFLRLYRLVRSLKLNGTSVAATVAAAAAHESIVALIKVSLCARD